ncbi:MAG: CotH kinase family protein, partial [Bacteroidota bacterium]
MKKYIYLIITLTVTTLQTLNAQIKLNELQSSNATTITSDLGNYADWIELYNTGSSTINIGGYFITDNNDEPRKWQIPTGTSISGNDYLLIWCDGLTTELHTNFKLSGSKGEKLYIYSSNMLLLDSVTFPPLTTDYTYGRVTDGTGQWAKLANPTPDAQNDSETIKGAAPAPTFSIPAGFYSSSQNISLNSSVSGAVIRYTTDGTEPTESSPIYTEPISVDKTTGMTLKYGYNRDNNTGIQEFGWPSSLNYPYGYYDNENEEFGAIIKAKVFHDDYAPSKTVASSYFINMRRPSLPIISITADKADFFSADRGIYIQGTNGIEKNGYTANWWQDDWERKVYIEYFDENGEIQFGVNAGAQIMGAVSRGWDQKSLKFKLRNEYGDSEINYPLFGDDGLQTYSSFYLRNSGNDWDQGNMARDGIIQSVVRGEIDLETLGYQPVVMYLNGEYFGIINLRERYDENLFAEMYSYVDEDEVDLLKINGDAKTFDPSEGDLDAYNTLLDYLNTFDLEDTSHYNYVIENFVDKDNIINYYIAQIYCQNTDWPHNNVRIWRPRMEKGKFRFLFYDTDFGYGYYGGGPYENNLSRALSSSSEESWSTVIFRSLMDNPQFENEFIQRFSYMINTIYTYDRLDNIANYYKDLIIYERDNYSDEIWTRGLNSGYSINDMISWGGDRIGYMREQINSRFGYEEYSYLTVNFTESNGSVYLCSLPVDAGYSGRQYENTPIRLVAEPKDGYQFVEWRSGSTTLST